MKRIFIGIEHRMRREEMEDNKESKQGWRFVCDAARITDENTGREDRKLWEQLLKQKKLSRLSQGMNEELPKCG